jgi:DNA polymerase-1
LERVTLLIDGDVVAYKAAAAVESEIDWGDDLWTLHSDLDEAKTVVLNQLLGWKDRLEAKDIIVAFSDSLNFRKDIYPLYKSNRKGKRKPVAYRPLVEWMTEAWSTFVRPGLEGDDVLGILSTSDQIIKGTKIIISVDKDFKTIPGWFFNPDKDVTPQFYDEGDADRWHMLQTLTGDATDGYPGLPGCGPKGAEKVLDVPHTEWWSAVVEAYEKKGLTEEDALIQARCARILRAEDYDFKQKEVKLWTPR